MRRRARQCCWWLCLQPRWRRPGPACVSDWPHAAWPVVRLAPWLQRRLRLRLKRLSPGVHAGRPGWLGLVWPCRRAPSRLVVAAGAWRLPGFWRPAWPGRRRRLWPWPHVLAWRPPGFCGQPRPGAPGGVVWPALPPSRLHGQRPARPRALRLVLPPALRGWALAVRGALAQVRVAAPAAARVAALSGPRQPAVVAAAAVAAVLVVLLVPEVPEVLQPAPVPPPVARQTTARR